MYMRQEYIDLFNNLIDLAKIVLPSLLTLAGGYLGYQYGIGQFRKQKKFEFVERQIREFYSPMIGCLKQIEAKSKLRYEISKASDPAWRKICAQHPHPFEDHEKYFEPFKKSILYNNNQLRNELIPLYDKMVTIFSENYWLADAETRKWYSELCGFVELWHRWLDESIPAEVIQEMNHTEERLKPLYQNLDICLENLKKTLVGK
jgi:hypothetical protein